MISPTRIDESSDSAEPLPSGVSLVVPCFNSALTLEDLVRRIAATLPRCCEKYELILVNDGSRDETWATVCRLAAEHPWIVGVELMRNYGQHNATLCGVRLARYDVTVTLDDDLQNPPEEIPRLLKKLDEGHDLVYGIPEKQSRSLFRRAASWLTRWAISTATGQREVRTITAFRAFQTDLRRASEHNRSPQVLVDVLLGWATTRVGTIHVVNAPRTTGRSNYRFLDLCRIVLLLWTGYTTAPLRLASWLGFAFMLFGIGVLTYVLAVYFSEGSLPGFPFLASIIALFSGAQLFTLGVIGEYIARLFAQSLDRPTYTVRTRTTSL